MRVIGPVGSSHHFKSWHLLRPVLGLRLAHLPWPPQLPVEAPATVIEGPALLLLSLSPVTYEPALVVQDGSRTPNHQLSCLLGWTLTYYSQIITWALGCANLLGPHCPSSPLPLWTRLPPPPSTALSLPSPSPLRGLCISRHRVVSHPFVSAFPRWQQRETGLKVT